MDGETVGDEHESFSARDFVHSATPPVAGALVAVGLGTAMAGPAGAVIGGVAGALLPEIAKSLEEYHRRAGRNADLVVNWTSELAGMSPAELHEWAVHDDARLSLLAATIQAALCSLDEIKARTLARVLAEATEDDAKLDVSTLVTKTLAELEPPHIRILRAMCTEHAPAAGPSRPANPGGWRQSGLECRFPNLNEGILPIMTTLERNALVRLSSTRASGDQLDRTWRLTDFGTYVHSTLARSAADLTT